MGAVILETQGLIIHMDFGWMNLLRSVDMLENNQLYHFFCCYQWK